MMLTYKKQSLHKIRNFSSINAYSPSQNKEDNIYKNFDFTITKVDSSSKARLSTINTPVLLFLNIIINEIQFNHYNDCLFSMEKWNVQILYFAEQKPP
jgi:hypothetical protein